MIRAIANKPLDLTDDEFQYYLSIIEAFGTNIFQDTFEVEDGESHVQYGWITLVKPPLNNTLPIGVVFFLFNVMLNQRMRKFEEMMDTK
jgi:hypothetical protein